MTTTLGTERMTTRETIERYFAALRERGAWQDLFSQEIHFTSFTSPVRELKGHSDFLSRTKGFYASIVTFELREIVSEGDRAVAFTRYVIQPASGGPNFSSDVAEVFRVRDGRIIDFAIYFDTAPYPK